ncbi:MAG: hypothetical protein R3284_11345 [Rubricoccaceae bacterium]|nr:hypothetical protein [Rubricoccaceae bacterium]
MVTFFAALCGCVENGDSPDLDEALVIELRWIKSYPDERRSDIETGLLWTLSFLGADLSRDEPSPISWADNLVILRLDRAGFNSESLSSWAVLISAMKASQEYAVNGSFDIGRFVALTLCSPHHYYALTGASSRYEDARARYRFDPQPVAVIESSVAYGNRLVEIPEGDSSADFAYIAHEGVGSIQQGSFRVVEHELLDLMPNGQLRFALYDLAGELKHSADDTLTAAGKPSKCLWCHETELSRPFMGRTSVSGYHSLNEFEARIAGQSEMLEAARARLRSRIDFSRKQDHTLAEFLYLGFYAPSAERVSVEWNVSVERAREILEGLPTHAHDEFPVLGAELYQRSNVDPLAPYEVIEVPKDPRESSVNEPNLLR